jgi:RNA polymerase sigma-B factor
MPSDELVHTHLGLARALAARYRNRGVAWDDLQQIANLGLVKAAHGFRVDAGTAFGAYATPVITGEIRRYFRDHGWSVRPPRRLQELRARLLAEDDRLPEQELADRIGASVAELRRTRLASQAYSALSLDAPRPDEATTSFADLAVGEDVCAAVDVHLSLRQSLASLSAGDRHLLHLRFDEELSQQRIAAELGVSQMQVSRLLSAVLERLRRDLDLPVPAPRRESAYAPAA